MYLFVLPTFSGGGAERVLVNLSRRLYVQGELVRLVVFDGSGPMRSLVPDSLPVDDLGSKSLCRSIIPLLFYIRRTKPKLIYSTLGYVNLALLVIAPLFPNRTLLWLREANLPSISLRNNRYSWLMWQGYLHLYRHADRLLVTSERMKMEFVDTFMVSDRILLLMPNPVDEGEIRSSAEEVKRIPGTGLRFVAAGRLTRQKGFDRLLYWFADLSQKDAHLVILGNGRMAGELNRLAVLLDIEQRVTFAGFVANPWSWYAGADAFLLPSRWEGMSNAVLEALACGTPVIATAESGGIAEVAEQVQAIDPDGVTVAHSGADFCLAMEQVFINETHYLNRSLLPDIYRADMVVRQFRDWIGEEY